MTDTPAVEEYLLSPQPVQQKFLNCNHDIVFYGGGGGGGKTWSILVDNLRFVDDKNYYSVFFRNTTTELETNLWPEAVKMYKPLLEYQSGPLKGKWIGPSRIKDKDHSIIFPSGAKSKFTYMQYDKDADSWYGAELSRAYFDEFQRFSAYQFHVIRSRLRSKAKFPSQMRCTLNPDQYHFVIDYIKPFLDEEGYPIPELSGVTRYFLIVKGVLYSSWDINELAEKFPDKKPKTYTYIPSTLADNKVLMDLEPDYADTLDSLPEDKRKQLLLGCWYVNDSDTRYFNREWLKRIAAVPEGAKAVRAWDKASEEPSPTLRYPDYTASLKMYRCKDGFYYIVNGTRFRKQPGERDRMIVQQALEDGDDCTVAVAIDPGAAGKFEFQEFAKKLIQEGVIVKKDPMPNNKSKLKRFEPFSAACQNGLVYIVESDWEKSDLDAWCAELENFTGERSVGNRKDDWVDATATAFNTLCKQTVIPVFDLGPAAPSTPLKDARQQ